MNNAFSIVEITSETLQTFRDQTDPLADETVAAIISSGDEKKVNELMMMLFRNASFKKGMFSSLGADLSELLDNYIEKTAVLPAWTDRAKIADGQQLFSLYGPEIFMLLNVSSLPMCYTCGKGAQVLFETGRLLSHNGNIDPLARRLMETAQMVVNVLAEGGLDEGGKGIVTLQKVRLIHASIRHFLQSGQYQRKSWDVSHFGQPINQEDLSGTLMSFGPVIIAGLKRLNIELSDTQIDNYMHCWKVVGHLMGIDQRLLPDSYEDGFELATKILMHQAEESEAGTALTDSCIAFMNYLIPGNAFNEVPPYFIEYFLQDFTESSGINLAKCVGIENKEDKKERILLAVTRFITGKLSHLEEHQFVRKLSSHFNKKLLNGIIHHFNDGKQVQFFIPPSLQADWELVDSWETRLATPGVLGARLALQKRSKP
ncbi:oxygenase MpaB family protein [Ekhidna sp.]|uniref:oxygenase MpaB family protein n=1 Tax=Ekhidna sp. TaxID=2608089 RepID=UPI003CCBBD5A